MQAREVLEGMDQRGINVVAHILNHAQHHYNVTRRVIQEMNGDIEVLKWEREERLGTIRRGKRTGKTALYQLAK